MVTELLAFTLPPAPAKKYFVPRLLTLSHTSTVVDPVLVSAEPFTPPGAKLFSIVTLSSKITELAASNVTDVEPNVLIR